MILFALFVALKIGIQILMGNDSEEEFLRNKVLVAEGDVESAAYELQQKEYAYEREKKALDEWLDEVK